MSISIPDIEQSILSRFPEVTHPFLQNIFKNKIFLTKKTSNFLLNQIEIKKGKSYLRSYPYYLVIDSTNICNLRCPLCPTWQDLQASPKGKMNLYTFKKVLDEIGPYLFAVNLCNWGEPLLNSDLPAMIKYAKKYNTVVGLSTNLNYLPHETARGLIESGIDIMVISLDGATQESYSRYRRGGNLSTVLRNIEKLNSYRKMNTKNPLLIWQFLVNKYNESEIDMARELARKMGLQFSPSPMRTSMGSELLLPLYERVKEMQDWLPSNPAYSKYAYEIKPETRTRQTTCTWLWNTTVINWDCSISPCCGVYGKIWDFVPHSYHSEGKRSKFHRAWNSPRYKRARKLVASYMEYSKNFSHLLKLSESQGLICSKCIRYGFLED